MTRSPMRSLFVILLAALLTFPAFAQEASVYTAPDDSFTVPIPEGWTVEDGDDAAFFTSPEEVQVYWLTVPAEDADSAAAAALEILAPEFDGMMIRRDEFPASGGIWVQQLYLSGMEIAVTLAFYDNGVAYVAWIPPVDEPTLVAISPALNEMLIGFTYANQLDLTGAEASPLDEDSLDKLDAYISDALVRYGIPGASVAVVQNGQVVFTGAYGVTNADTETPLTADTLFMIGSITKSLTATLMATLVDDGAFDWDTPVTDIYPDFALADPERTAQVTMGDLLSMATGVGRYDIPLFLETRSETELLADLATFPLVTGYHEAYNYSNQMVTAGGFITAIATGAAPEDSAETYADLLQSRLFDPLDMSSTTLDFEGALESGRAASPHYLDWLANAFLPTGYDFERFTITIAPSGAVWSTASDMAKFMLMQLEDGEAADGMVVVSAENLGVTHEPVIEIADGVHYAMGWLTADYYGQPMITHDGGTTGFSSDVALFPEANLGIIVLTNRSGGTAFMNAVRDYTVELAFGLDHAADAVHLLTEQTVIANPAYLIQQANLTETPPDPEVVAPYLGAYERGVTVGLADDGTLMLTGAYGEIPLYLAGEQNGDTYITANIVSGIRVMFAETDDGVTATFVSLLEIGTPSEQYGLVLHKIS